MAGSERLKPGAALRAIEVPNEYHANLYDSRAAAPTPLGDGAAARFMRDSPSIRVAAAIALDVLVSSRRSDPATHVRDGHVLKCVGSRQRADELPAVRRPWAPPSPRDARPAAAGTPTCTG